MVIVCDFISRMIVPITNSSLEFKEINMKVLEDLCAKLKEWSDWGMRDWIKAGIVCVVVLFILYKMTGGGA